MYLAFDVDGLFNEMFDYDPDRNCFCEIAFTLDELNDLLWKYDYSNEERYPVVSGN